MQIISLMEMTKLLKKVIFLNILYTFMNIHMMDSNLAKLDTLDNMHIDENSQDKLVEEIKEGEDHTTKKSKNNVASIKPKKLK